VAGDLTLVTIERDLDWEAAALPLLADWWTTFVVGDTPPPGRSAPFSWTTPGWSSVGPTVR
jgi:hypothetical protein